MAIVNMERKTLTLKRKVTPPNETDTALSPTVSRKHKTVVVNTAPPRAKKAKSGKPATAQPKKKPAMPTPKSPPRPVEKKPVLPKKPKKHLPLSEAIALMTTYWPDLFPDGVLRPMKVGLREDLFEDRQARQLPVSAKQLKRALSSVSHSARYRTTLTLGANRHDKQGQPCGTVSESDVTDTLKRLQRLIKQQAAHVE